jgi:hypothetical protein
VPAPLTQAGSVEVAVQVAAVVEPVAAVVVPAVEDGSLPLVGVVVAGVDVPGGGVVVATGAAATGAGSGATAGAVSTGAGAGAGISVTIGVVPGYIVAGSGYVAAGSVAAGCAGAGVSAVVCVGAGPKPVGSLPTLDVTGVGAAAVD